MHNSCQLYKRQAGGNSDWMHSSNSISLQPGPLTKVTLQYIDQAPMFNPFQFNTVIPTANITGIYPQGIYYMNQAAQTQCQNLPTCTEPGIIKRQVTSSNRVGLVDKLKNMMN